MFLQYVDFFCFGVSFLISEGEVFFQWPCRLCALALRDVPTRNEIQKAFYCVDDG